MAKSIIQQRTIKINLNLEKDQEESLLTCMNYSKVVFDLFVNLCCEHRSCSYMALHKHGYALAKILCPGMPTAYIQAVAKIACGAVKSFNTRNKKNKFCYKGRRKSLTLPLNKLTFSRRGDLMTISSCGKRIRVLGKIPEWFVSRYQVKTNNVQSGQIIYNPSAKKSRFQIALTYKIEPDAKTYTEKTSPVIIGVDRGLYNLYATSEGELHPSKKIIRVKRKIQFLRSKLQACGTRSAKRHLKKLSGREKRFTRDCNHCAAKKLASNHDADVFVLEKLQGIRKQRKGKKLNSWLSHWSFYQFQQFLEYKCFAKGIEVKYVDPRYTSQKCSCCGAIDKNSRKKSKYICRKCGYHDHADINASKNIRDNYAHHLKDETGCLQPANRIIP